MKTKIFVCLLVLVFGANSAKALVQFKDGGVHNIDYTINDDVWVDYQAPGVQTTVNLLVGGTVPRIYKLKGFNSSKINLSDGSDVYDLWVSDTSQVTMSGGTVGSLNIYDSSQMTRLGGIVNSNIHAKDNSQITISGGTGGRISIEENSYAIISGGAVYAFGAYDNSQITISGGTVTSGSTARGNSHVTILDGVIDGSFSVSGDSQMTMSGGTLGYLFASGNALVTILGGSMGGLNVCSNSQVTMSGGTIDSQLQVWHNAEMTINGFDFAIDGNPVDFGEIVSITGGDFDVEPFRRLTGTLANGDVFNNQFKVGNLASINLMQGVPEPAAIVLLITGLLAGGFLLRRK